MGRRVGPIQLSLAGLVLVACVVIPFLSWQGTWFGRPLDDETLTQYLADQTKSRRVQHALAQIAERMERGDPEVAQWYEMVAQLSEHPGSEVRVTAAWLMGHDSTSELFHKALLQMVHDEEVLVRRNAALALVRFGDDKGLNELRAMLAFPVDAGQELLTLSPDPEHVWESLRALALVGGAAELQLVDSVSENPHLSEEVREQATLTRQAIQTRLAAIEETGTRSQK
ncbi:MAG: HEAT repeat domain-containing protein [Acidobacteria bacterium]|nr:HEAT repeat domain-containing protein [Acidobacteriota bacterium]